MLIIIDINVIKLVFSAKSQNNLCIYKKIINKLLTKIMNISMICKDLFSVLKKIVI